MKLRLQELILRVHPIVNRNSAAILFALIALPSVGWLAVKTPIGWGLDEPLHAYRSYYIAKGNWSLDKLSEDGKYGGEISTNLYNAMEYGQKLSRLVNPAKSSCPDGPPIYCISDQEKQTYLSNSRAEDKIGGSTSEVNFGPTGPYYPIVYYPGVFAMQYAINANLSVSKSVKLARLSQGLFYILAIFSALTFLRSSTLKWVIFVTALLPTALYQSATLTTDSFTNAVVLLFVSCVVSLFLDKRKLGLHKLLALWLLMLLMTVIKPSYTPIALVGFLLPRTGFASRQLLIIHRFILPAVMLLVVTVVTLSIGRYSDAPSTLLSSAQAADVNIMAQLKDSILNPINFLGTLINTLLLNGGAWVQMYVGIFGDHLTISPPISVVVSTVLLFFACFHAEKIPRSYALGLLVTGFISILATMGILYLTFNPVGAPIIGGIQGRYFIPSLFVCLIGLASYFRSIEIIVPSQWAAKLIVATTSLILLVTLLDFAQVIT